MLSPELVNQSRQFLVLCATPSGLGLSWESSEATVAHLGISAGDAAGDVFESYILIAAEGDQESVLLLGPGAFCLSVSFLDQVLSRNHDLFGYASALIFEGSVKVRGGFGVGLSGGVLEKGEGLSRNHYVIIWLVKGIIDVFHVFKNYDINISPFMR